MMPYRLVRWGLILLVFGVVALSGPGRIDIVDGDTRYEVARGLVELGDPVVRDPDIWFNIFPGRDGKTYSYYRWPQSVLGVPAIGLADLLGPPSEDRRRFVFSLIGAVAAGVLAATWHALFRDRGLSNREAAAWALAGVFCTPAWYFATSTYDDILGATAVVGVAFAAGRARRGSLGWALVAGLLVGLATNCKQPLLAWLVAAWAIAWDPARPARDQLGRHVAIGLGAAVGLASYVAWDLWRYPPGSTDGHAELLAVYMNPYWANPLVSWAAWLFSGGASVVLYFPPILLCVEGLRRRWREEPVAVAGLAGSVLAFATFVSLLTWFKGDPSWGPRYLTACFTALWMFAPDAAVGVRARNVVLALGLAVQLLGIAVDPHRLYVERGLPNAWSAAAPVALFVPAYGHILQRPREIAELLADDHTPTRFTPAAELTSAFPMVQDIAPGPEAVHTYAVLDTFRPFWIAHQAIEPAERPVPVGAAVGVFAACALAGAALVGRGLRSA